MSSQWAAVVMAAGKGTRMKSRTPKALHRVCGLPMLLHPLNAARAAGIPRQVVVASPENEAAVRALLGDSAECVLQSEALGTGHAALQPMPLLEGTADQVLVLNGDLPLIRSETLSRMMQVHVDANAAVTILTSGVTPVQAMGRVVRDARGKPVKVVEEADATEAERGLTEMNAGAYCFRAAWLWENLGKLKKSPKGEFYLTDVIALASGQGETVESCSVSDALETQGVNTRLELARVEAAMRQRVRERWMLAGVTMLDPATTYIDSTVELDEDVTLHPNTTLLGRTKVRRDSEIGPFSVLRDSIIGERCIITASFLEESTVEPDVTIGPFSHLRPGAHLESHVHMGNFGEVKNSRLGRHVAMGHFSYVGDAEIGANVNIGAGTITCNFDGVKKNRTVVEKGAFIGSDTLLVAPVKVGAGATTGAGAVVTRDVPPDTIAVGVPARVVKRKSAARPPASKS